MKRTVFVLGMALGILSSATADADQLLLNTTKQTEQLATPTRGVTMDEVKQHFGMPSRILPAVGEPPITRWIYPQFIVYFERQWVIHSVITAKRLNEKTLVQNSARKQ